MSTAIQRFRTALQEQQIPDDAVERIFAGYESISDRSPKDQQAAFFAQAVEHMDVCLDPAVCREVRDACACSKGGWRLKAMQKIAKEMQGQSLENRLAAIGQVTYMGSPALREDGRIVAGIGTQGGFACPCPVFDHQNPEQAVSKTYCYCCAGHFRFHYQIALGRSLRTVEVRSSALNSQRSQPCRFVYELLN